MIQSYVAVLLVLYALWDQILRLKTRSAIVAPGAMAPKRAPKEPVDVLARKGYYDEMTNTFEEINEKRDIIEKDLHPFHEIRALLEERDDLVKTIAELQSQLDAVNLSNKASLKAQRKTERVLRQLEAGGAVARAALRKLLLSRMTLEERVAKVREEMGIPLELDPDFRLSCNWPSSPVSSQKLKRTDLTMKRQLTSEEGEGEITIPMRSYVAGGLEQPPVIVFFHGESYVAGDLDTHDWICSALAQLSRTMVLSVAYRQPPEVRYPGPLEDAYGALRWEWPGTISRSEYLQRLYGQRSSAPRLGLHSTELQQRPLRSVGLGILESLSGPVATVPLSGAQMKPPHGISVNPEIPQKVRRNSGQRQVKDNFVNRVVEMCGPAVVRIQTEQKVEVPAFTNLGGLTQRATKDEVIDLAALKVKEKTKLPLPAMPLGYSEVVKTGNPLGLQNTCTLGIVSSLDRSTGETGFDWMRHPLIQTDAAVNQGNSGGPMLNEDGEVIGMISMRALFGEGIGFAIPVDSIRSALPSLISRKKVPRPYIGLKMKSSLESCGQGAFVEMVLEGSPAEEAKLQENDQIVEVNGQKLRHFDQVQMAVRSTKVGGQLKLKIKRGKETVSATVTTADIRKLREAKGQESPKRNLGWTPTLGVSGDASGGGLAMACALRARKEAAAGAPDIRFQVLFYPWVDVRPTSQSMQSCQEDNDLHILMQEDLAFASEVYGPPRQVTGEEDDDDDDEPKVEDWMKVEEVSPLLASSLQDLPRTFLAYAADDLLAPDCRSLATRLRKEAGTEAVHELELPGPLGPGFAKDPTRAASYAALAAAGAFASGVLTG
eukprot:s786_g19.t1